MKKLLFRWFAVSSLLLALLTISAGAAWQDDLVTLLKAKPTAPVCGEHVGWTALEQTSGTLAAGKYYLDGDVTLTGELKVSSGEVTLCLNGHTMTGKTKAVMLNISGGTVNICDCSAGETGKLLHVASGQRIVKVAGATLNLFGGTLTSNDAAMTLVGGGAYIGTDGVFNMMDGAITRIACSAIYGGGGVYNEFGTFNMYGGEISYNKATHETNGRGGGVVLAMGGSATGTCTFNLIDGTISNNVAESTTGGGVHANNNTAFNMYGGTISGNTAETAGGGVYSGGTKQAKNLYGGMIRDNTAKSEANLSGSVTTKTTAIVDTPAAPTKPECGEHTDWTALTATTVMEDGGKYVATGELTDVVLTGSGEVTLCLNGQTLTAAASAALITWTEGTLNICDCAGSGVLQGNGTMIIDVAGGTVNLFAGTLKGTSTSDSACVTISTATATFNMCGGTITGNTSSATAGAKRGGGVGVAGTFNMYAGEISGNKAPNGGGVRMSYLTARPYFNMYGGTIKGNTATDNSSASAYGGGGVLVTGSTTFNLIGGTISGNTAGRGAGVSMTNAENCHFTMYGGAIEGNTTNKYFADWAGSGAGLWCKGSSCNIYGGTIANNKGAYGAGGVKVDGCTLNMYGGSITGNAAGSSGYGGGGLQVANDGTFNLYGGDISKNTVYKNGGGVRVYNGTANMYGGTISENTNASDGNGGGVHVVSGHTFTLYNGTISGNIATAGSGGGVHNEGTFVMHNGTISGNITSGGNTWGGGGVAVNGSNGKFTLNGGTIVDNTVDESKQSGVDVYVYSKGTLTMNGGTIGNTTATNARLAFYNASAATITGGRISEIYTNGAGTIDVSGGKFGENASEDFVATGMATYAAANTVQMLSVINNTDDDADIYPYVVGEGFSNVGEYIGHDSAIEFGLALNADYNFINVITEETFNEADYTVTVTGSGLTLTGGIDWDPAGTGNLLLKASGIAAKEMHDDITFTVMKGDAVWFQDTVSVYDAAAAWSTDTNTADDIMLADMINYGIAAQNAFGYKTDDVAALKVSGTADAPTWEATGLVSNTSSAEVAASLSLKDEIELNIYVAGADMATEDANPGCSVESKTDEQTGKAMTRININNIPVKDFAEMQTVTLSDGTVTFSIKDYVVTALEEANKDAEANANEIALLKALQKYVESVTEYLGE